MKRILPFLLALSLLCACAKPAPQENPTYAFYYPQKQITYCSETGVLASEARSFPVGLEFKKILNLYLEGPVSESLRTPFPLMNVPISPTISPFSHSSAVIVTRLLLDVISIEIGSRHGFFNV